MATTTKKPKKETKKKNLTIPVPFKFKFPRRRRCRRRPRRRNSQRIQQRSPRKRKRRNRFPQFLKLQNPPAAKLRQLRRIPTNDLTKNHPLQKKKLPKLPITKYPPSP